MPVHGRRRPRLWLGALAAAGVGLTHILAYFLTAPDPEARRELLAQTAHGYWSYASAIALGVLVAGLSGFVITRLKERVGGPQDGGALYTYVATRLLLLQTVGFLTLEASERAFAGGLEHFLSEPVVMLGLAIQAVVAAIGAVLLLLLARIVEALIEASRPLFLKPTAPLFAPVLSVLQPHTSLAAGGATPRAPPVS